MALVSEARRDIIDVIAGRKLFQVLIFFVIDPSDAEPRRVFGSIRVTRSKDVIEIDQYRALSRDVLSGPLTRTFSGIGFAPVAHVSMRRMGDQAKADEGGSSYENSISPAQADCAVQAHPACERDVGQRADRIPRGIRRRLERACLDEKVEDAEPRGDKPGLIIAKAAQYHSEERKGKKQP